MSDIQTVTPDEIDDSDRARFFVIRHARGSLKLSANEFRLALGPDRVRSTRIRIERVGDQFLFKGKGWGHGVGMCQFGAKHLAELGYRYTDILRYYYPESEIRNIEGFLGEGAQTSVPSGGESVFKRWYGKLKSYVEDL